MSKALKNARNAVKLDMNQSFYLHLLALILSSQKKVCWYARHVLWVNHPEMRIFKRTMSPQAHARVDEKQFEIGGPAFSNTVASESSRSCFHLFESRSS